MKNASFKLQVREWLNAEPGGIGTRRIHSFLSTLILLNLAALILETVPPIEKPYRIWFQVFEVFSVAIFTVEYALRIWVADIDETGNLRKNARWKYIKSPMAVIDLLAILPSYLPLLPLDLRFLRSFRLIRVIRIFKLVRYNSALQTLIRVVHSRREELVISVFLGLFLLTVSASCVYYFEHDSQPDKFSSIPAAMWWAAAALTTVGYGDVFPITVLGRIFGAITAFLGVGMFALPAGIIASGFAEAVSHRHDAPDRKCPHCGHVLNPEGQ